MAHRTCPAPDCIVLIPSELFACRVHWFQLPRAFRRRVWRAYDANNLAETLALYEEAAGIWLARSAGARA